ncbi:unnamed protein product [Orchesella dallaii]|uniref:Protein grindelwald n=1 Tax=Orchesella dallaii TaxID=48710 RepID=A0ABP1R033_9HEXA
MVFYPVTDRIPRLSINKANYFDLILIVQFIIAVLPEVTGKLTLSKQCGEIVCKAHYYCARIDDSCRPCQETCDRALSNYDQDVCEKDCQDYLHDLFYMRKSLLNQSEYEDEKVRLFYDDIQGELLTLKILIMITIIMSTLVMISLFFLMMYLKRSRNRLGISNPGWCGDKEDITELPVIYSNAKCFTLPRNSTESAPNLSNSVNNNASRVSTPDVVSRSESAIPVSVLSVKNLSYADPPLMKSQKFRREPSESTLPDYLGYDNPALAPSPTHI